VPAVTTTGTQTLTNKTLTSPKVNEDVVVTATATEINVLDGITASTAELNIMDGVTASTAELNILDGATLTTTELNYVDGVTSAIQTQITTNTPVGVLAPYAGSAAPTGWLLCAGQEISKTTYSALYSIIGVNTYGTDTTSGFFLPDLRGRVVAGKDNMNGTTASRLTSSSGMIGTTLGATGGNQLLQEHNHGINSRPSDGVTTGSYFVQPVQSTQGVLPTETANTGFGNSQNVQPTIILNYIIKF
jgi:microcystin-dependent protein